MKTYNKEKRNGVLGSSCDLDKRRNQKCNCRELEDSPDSVCKSEMRKADKERENL